MTSGKLANGQGDHDGQQLHVLDGDLLVVRIDPQTTLPQEMGWVNQLVQCYADQGIHIQVIVLPKGVEIERIPAQQAKALLEERLHHERITTFAIEVPTE